MANWVRPIDEYAFWVRWAYIFGEVRLGVYSTKTKEGILEIVQGCREQELETT